MYSEKYIISVDSVKYKTVCTVISTEVCTVIYTKQCVQFYVPNSVYCDK